MIIVEGPDGAGKTTLCQRIIQEFPELKLWEESVPRDQLAEEDPIARVWAALGRELTPTEPEYVYDRLYFSELVYGEVLRGNVYGTYYDHESIRGMLHALKVPIIYCRPSLSVIQYNIRLKGHMDGVVDNLEAIVDKYDSLIRYSPYDFVKPNSVSQVLEAVQMSIHRREARTW